jgi:hypothetical protein
MKRLITATLTLTVAVILLAGSVYAQSKPEFKLGFKALADQAPEVVGEPIEAEHWGANGDSLQQTTTGLMAWRKADNWTAFTNGARTWINGPSGVQDRGNDERFDWEGDASVGGTPPTSSSGGTSVSTPTPQTAGDSVPRFGPSNWSEFQPRANDYKGKWVELAGVLFTTPEKNAKGVYVFQVVLDSASHGNTMVTTLDAPTGISKSDYVIVRGICDGSVEWTNLLGGQTSAALVYARSVNKVSRADAWAPTLKQIPVNKTVEDDGVAVRIEKIEIAKEETRVFGAVKNNTNGGIHAYEHNAKLAVGSKQFVAKASYDSGYPSMPSPIMPGVEFNTVLVYDPSDPSPGTIRILWDGMSLSDYKSVKPFTWEIPYQ